MGQFEIPLPPEPPTPPQLKRAIKWFTKWIVDSFRKEPVGWIALGFPILLGIATSLLHSISGPDVVPILEFDKRLVPETQYTAWLSVENYSNFPAQGLRVTLASSSDTLIHFNDRADAFIGTIQPNSVSSPIPVSVISHRLGKVRITVRLERFSKESNITPTTHFLDFEVQARTTQQ